FGVILYEALTGDAPYPASNFQQLIVQLGSVKATPPRKLRPEIPRELERLILSALSHDREQRPESIDALIKALLPYREQSGEARARETARPSPLAHEVTGARRAWWKPALLASALCMACVGGWLLASREPVVSLPRLPPVMPELARAEPVVAAPAAALVPDGVEAPDAGSTLVASKPLVPASSARLAPPIKAKPIGAPVATMPAVRHDEPRRRRTPGMSQEEF
ncbi:MAG TPA: hypothetical protein VFX59_28015, partial [Polyangiales bacterium]|nr:hypothetical protein [Polyangiales bacterium]